MRYMVLVVFLFVQSFSVIAFGGGGNGCSDTAPGDTKGEEVRAPGGADGRGLEVNRGGADGRR